MKVLVAALTVIFINFLVFCTAGGITLFLMYALRFAFPTIPYIQYAQACGIGYIVLFLVYIIKR